MGFSVEEGTGSLGAVRLSKLMRSRVERNRSLKVEKRWRSSPCFGKTNQQMDGDALCRFRFGNSIGRKKIFASFLSQRRPPHQSCYPAFPPVPEILPGWWTRRRRG